MRLPLARLIDACLTAVSFSKTIQAEFLPTDTTLARCVSFIRKKDAGPRLTMHSQVVAQTVRFDHALSKAEVAALEDRARSAGITARAQSNPRLACTYVLLESPSGEFDVIAQCDGGIALQGAIIALAIEPEAADALPYLLQALAGPGGARDATARISGAALVLEFDPASTSWQVLRALIDAELRRFGPAVKRTALLSPLSAAMEAAVAAEGLTAPEIEPSRILEVLVARAGR